MNLKHWREDPQTSTSPRWAKAYASRHRSCQSIRKQLMLWVCVRKWLMSCLNHIVTFGARLALLTQGPASNPQPKEGKTTGMTWLRESGAPVVHTDNTCSTDGWMSPIWILSKAMLAVGGLGIYHVGVLCSWVFCSGACVVQQRGAECWSPLRGSAARNFRWRGAPFLTSGG